jgi:hypothetical protein
MAIGHASGCAAAMAATTGVAPRKLEVKALQKLLLGQKAELRMRAKSLWDIKTLHLLTLKFGRYTSGCWDSA